MKKVLSTMLLAAAIFVPAAVNAQSTQIATLAHDGEIRLFTGASALIDAHEAAVDGDIITLSPGSFSATTITKHITLRGAGMFMEDNGTIINGILIIAPTTVDDEQPIALEGLHLHKQLRVDRTNKVVVSKCYIDDYGPWAVCNITFVNSFVSKVSQSNSGEEVTYINSVVLFPLFGLTSSKATYVFENCYITYQSSSNCFGNSTVSNSLLIDKASGTTFASSATLMNCVILSEKSSVLQDCNSVNNTVISLEPTEIWKDEARYVLTDENAKNWLGGDGTQVSIYGGMMPFDPTPSNPQITRFNVASKTSADGKLSVDIEVKSAE